MNGEGRKGRRVGVGRRKKSQQRRKEGRKKVWEGESMAGRRDDTATRTQLISPELGSPSG